MAVTLANATGEQMSETLSVDAYVDTPTHVLDAANGVTYAYRSTGPAGAPPASWPWRSLSFARAGLRDRQARVRRQR
jgi:hypothetical protein